MFYYAYLDANDIVVEIYGLPTQITHPSYILIPTNDRTLIGKRYNRATGEFEVVIRFYYAVLGAKDIVTEVIVSETEITDPNKISIPSNDTSLVGKWYNRATGQFLTPPIHILADHTTQQINIVNQDKWLQTELDELETGLTGHQTQLNAVKTDVTALQTGLNTVRTDVTGLQTGLNTVRTDLTAQGQSLQTQLNTVKTDVTGLQTQLNVVKSDLTAQGQSVQTSLNGINSKLTSLDRASFGGYKCRFDIEDNQQTTSAWVNGDGKHYTFSFNTGLPGYFPKMIRLVNDYFGDATLVADLYIVKNPDGSVKEAYLDKTYIGVSRSAATGTAAARRIQYDIDMEDTDAVSIGRYSNGKAYDEGGSAFFQSFTTNNSDVSIGNFSYTENTLSFDMAITSNLVGNYTDMNLRGYVF